MSFEAKIIAHSVATSSKVELVTFQLCYPRFIHAELMTHRVFSRNAMSSRAVPVVRMILQARENPAMPIHWGRNQPGMQASEECATPVTYPDGYGYTSTGSAEEAWRAAAFRASEFAEAMMGAGYHKQVVNRILEPFQWMHTIVSATEWSNFFELRCHADAQPEFHHLACLMRDALIVSDPVLRRMDRYSEAAWHLPYVSHIERKQFDVDMLVKVSAARCARVSYWNHDGTDPDAEKDLALYERLVGSRPLHASPVEHQAYPLPQATWSNNFRGWRQFRELIDVREAA